jgi:hypothetical protein
MQISPKYTSPKGKKKKDWEAGDMLCQLMKCTIVGMQISLASKKEKKKEQKPNITSPKGQKKKRVGGGYAASADEMY